jgi:uncharacterized protein (UPF0276 family)
LKALVDRYQPALVSEHLAWSAHAGTYFADLLPTLMTEAALDAFCAHVSETQDVLGRTILVENPSRYLRLPEAMPEAEFLAEAVRRTGCGLLLDINNIQVSAQNLNYEARAYLDAIPAEAVGEFHLAGHEADEALGGALLIDTHGASVAESVWDLYAAALDRIGPRPTLIERDADLPPLEALMQERGRAQALLEREAVHV